MLGNDTKNPCQTKQCVSGVLTLFQDVHLADVNVINDARKRKK